MNKNNKNIIQFSPIRSGSTLVFNILKEIFVDVKKVHNLNFNNNKNYVVTVRHPYNSIISSIIRLNEDINEKNLINHINEYKKNGGNDILKYDNQKNICLIKYEIFVDDYSFIINSIRNHFNIEIENSDILIRKFSIDNVTKIMNKYDSFHQYDKRTHIHGNHISKYKGLTDYQKILSEDNIDLLKKDETLNKIIKKFNYTI